LTEKGGF